jgi:predicted phage-related endonuclease
MLETLGLTAEQIEARKAYVGGSDANILLSGDAEKIRNLWLLKRGLVEPDDLSGVLPVMLGSYTEPFNRNWFQKVTGRIVTDVGVEYASLEWEHMAATIDGLTDNGKTVFEAKHVNPFGKADEVLAKYMPQLTHNMIVTGTKRAVLSVIFGNMKWEAFEVSLDRAYAEQLIEIERAFWACVKSGTEPVATEVKAPVTPVRTVDMNGSNAWAVAAADWAANKAAAKVWDDACKALRALVEDDVQVAHGHGVMAKRSKAGAILISAEKEGR